MDYFIRIKKDDNENILRERFKIINETIKKVILKPDGTITKVFKNEDEEYEKYNAGDLIDEIGKVIEMIHIIGINEETKEIIEVKRFCSNLEEKYQEYLYKDIDSTNFISLYNYKGKNSYVMHPDHLNQFINHMKDDIKNYILILNKPINLDDYLKAKCFYYAKTELYDRTLTNLRSQYDPTEAYIEGENRKLSNKYAFNLYLKIKQIFYKNNNYFYIERWESCDSSYKSLSAQGWIDMYNSLDKKGELDFIKSEICI